MQRSGVVESSWPISHCVVAGLQPCLHTRKNLGNLISRLINPLPMTGMNIQRLRWTEISSTVISRRKHCCMVNGSFSTSQNGLRNYGCGFPGPSCRPVGLSPSNSEEMTWILANRNMGTSQKMQGMDQGPGHTHDPYPPIHTLIHTLWYCMIHTLDPYPWSIPLSRWRKTDAGPNEPAPTAGAGSLPLCASGSWRNATSWLVL